MSATQPAVVQFGLDQPLQVALREVGVPEIGPGDVLLAVGAASVCGSDVHQAYLTHSWPVNTPVTLGHEFGGVVAQVGADVRGFQEGDRVVSETAAYICGQCLLCRTGRYNLCPSRKGFGYGIDGGMAQYVRVPARCLHHIPDALPFDIACLTEPHCVAYQSMCVNADITPGSLVVVLGPGPIGLLCAKMAALSGAYPLVVAGRSADRERLEVALAYGASHVVDVDTTSLDEVVRSLDPLGADVICDATGASRPLDAALALCRPDGQVVKVGWSPDLVPVNLNPLVQKNLRLQGSFSHTYPVWERVIALLAAGRTSAERIIGTRVGLEHWQEAFEGMHSGLVIKSVLLPHGPEGPR